MMRIVRKAGACVLALEWLVVLLVALPACLRADDCGSDRSRLEDCLRSEGYAQGISTTVNIIATVLVNGVAVQTLILGTRTVTVKPGEEPPQPKEYLMNVMTQDQRTIVDAETGEPLWVYAEVSCTDPKVNTAAITSAITFAAAGANANWLSLGQPAVSGGCKAVAVTAAPPFDGAELQPGASTIHVYAQAEGRTISATVSIEIKLDDYEMEFS